MSIFKRKDYDFEIKMLNDRISFLEESAKDYSKMINEISGTVRCILETINCQISSMKIIAERLDTIEDGIFEAEEDEPAPEDLN